MIDRAAAVAAFLVEEQHDTEEPEELWREMRRRWPDVTREQARRGAAIAAEILSDGIAEGTAQAEAVASILQEAEANAEAAFRAQVEAAIRAIGEEDFRAIAESSGIPLDRIRTDMAAIQRGEPLP